MPASKIWRFSSGDNGTISLATRRVFDESATARVMIVTRGGGAAKMVAPFI